MDAVCPLSLCAAKFKNAVSLRLSLRCLRLSLRCWNVVDGRYAMCRGRTLFFTAPFQIADGGAATAGTGGRHISHGFETQSVSNAGQTQVQNYASHTAASAGRPLVQSVARTVQLEGELEVVQVIEYSTTQHRRRTMLVEMDAIFV